MPDVIHDPTLPRVRAMLNGFLKWDFTFIHKLLSFFRNQQHLQTLKSVEWQKLLDLFQSCIFSIEILLT